jgi:uncharacterized membrane protein YhhN
MARSRSSSATSSTSRSGCAPESASRIAQKQPPRLVGALALIGACIVMTYVLVPRDNPMFAPLAVYTGVLTLMALCSFTLPAARCLVMLGAVLFFISDGFVAWNMFHHDPDPTLAYWRSFAGWMIYWAGTSSDLFRRASDDAYRGASWLRTR